MGEISAVFGHRHVIAEKDETPSAYNGIGVCGEI